MTICSGCSKAYENSDAHTHASLCRVCAWPCFACGKPLTEHADALPTSGTHPRMPCLGIKAGYHPRAARPTVPTARAAAVPVIVESPYAGDVGLHLRYLRACMRDAVLRGESPYASHALLTQPGVLRDEVLEERELGITAGFAWRCFAQLTVFYEDLGWSSGMNRALRDCTERQLPFQVRVLGAGWDAAQRDRELTGHAAKDWAASIVWRTP